MEDHADEFVFKRKRRRLRTNVQDTESPFQAADELHSGLVPELTVLPEPASSPAFPEPPGPRASPEIIVTVDKFLRCAAQTGLEAKQIVPGGPRAYSRHRPTERRTTTPRRVHKVPRRQKGSSQIAKALFRATVLTCGDPIDTLVDGVGISLARRPLKFVPFDKFARPLGQTNSVEPFDPGRGEDTVLHTRRLGGTSDLKAHHHRSPNSHPRIPLGLVPLREAEAAYSVMFPSRHALLKHS